MAPKRLWNFKIFCILSFWPPKRPQNLKLTWSAQHNFGVPKLLNFMEFFMWPFFLIPISLSKYFTFWECNYNFETHWIPLSKLFGLNTFLVQVLAPSGLCWCTVPAWLPRETHVHIVDTKVIGHETAEKLFLEHAWQCFSTQWGHCPAGSTHWRSPFRTDSPLRRAHRQLSPRGIDRLPSIHGQG